MSGTICRIKNRYSKEYDLIKEALLNRQDLTVALGMDFQDISLKEYLMHDDTNFTLADNLLTAKDKKSIIRNIYNELTEQQKEEFRANNPDLLDLVNNISEKQYDSHVVNNSNFTGPLQNIFPSATKLGTSSVNFIPIFSPEMNRILFSEITSEFQQRCFWNEDGSFFYYIDSNESLTDALELYKEKLLNDLFEYVNPENIERFSFGSLSDEKYTDYKRLMEEAWKLIKTKVESKNGKLDIQITENTRKAINGIKAFYILNNFDDCIRQTLGDNIIIKENEKDKLNTSEDKYSKKRASRENVNWNDNFKTSDGDNLVDRIMDIFTTTTVVPETGAHLQKDFMDKIILVCKEIYENDFLTETESLPENLKSLMDNIAYGDTNKAIEALIALLITENKVTNRIGRNECKAFGERLQNSQLGFNFQKNNLNAKEAAQFDLQYNIAAKLINNFKKGLLTYTSIDQDGNISTTSCVDKKKSKEFARRKLKSAILRNQLTHNLGFYSPNIMVANTTSTNIQDLFSEKAQNYLTKITGINFKDSSFISRFNNATNIAILNKFLADLNYTVKKASEHKSNLSFEKALDKELDTLQTMQSWVQFSNILTEKNEYELQRMFDQNGNELPKTTIPVLSTTIADLRKEAKERGLDGNCNILLREGLTRKHAELLGGTGTKYNSYSSMISFLNDVMTKDGIVKRWVELEPQTLLYNSIFSLYFNQVVNNQVATFQLDVASDKPKVPAININLASEEGKILLESNWRKLETELFRTNKNYYIKVKYDILNAWNKLELKDAEGNTIVFGQVSEIAKYLEANRMEESDFTNKIRTSVGTNGELFQKGIVWDAKNGQIILNPVLIDELARYDVAHEDDNEPTAAFNEYCHNSFKAFLSDLIKNRVDFNKFLIDNFDLLTLDKKQRILQLFDISTDNLSAEKVDEELKSIKESLDKFGGFGDYKNIDLDQLIKSNSPIISMLRKYMTMYNLTREGGLQLMQRHYWAHGGSSESAKISKAVKRNNAESGTCAFLQQDVKYGVPKKIRTAQVQSLNTVVKNMFGDSATIHSHDGAIFTLGIARFWERNSSPSIFIADAAKTITFNPQGAGFIQYKCADYAMTNSWIRQTLRNGEGGKDQSYDGRILIQKMMSEGVLTEDFFQNWSKNTGVKFGVNIPIVSFNGRKAKLEELLPAGNNSITAIYKYLDDNSYVPDDVVQKCLGVIQSDEFGNLQCKTVYDLWKILGAEYCEEYKDDGSIDYGENSQELIAYLISEFDPDIKEQLICKIIDPESSKSTSQITNSRKDTFNSPKSLITTNIKTKWYGAQLDYSHQSDEDEIAGPTQAIAAICFNGENSEMVEDLYETLGRVTTESLGDVIILMDESNKTAFYRKLGKKCIDALKSNNIVSNTQVILEQALSEIVKNSDKFAPKALPLSDNKVYHLAAEQILSTLNKTIRQRFAGTAVIQNPSQGIISCYENIHGIVFTASEIARKANQWAAETINPDTGEYYSIDTQDSIIQNYLNNSSEFGSVKITDQNLGLLNIGYRVSLNGKEMEISDPTDLWTLEEAVIKGQTVEILHNKARNLATTNIIFNLESGQNMNIWMLPSTKALLEENKKGLTPIRIWHMANVRALKEQSGFYASLEDFKSKKLTKVKDIQFKGGEQALPKQYRRLMGLNDTMGNIRSQGADYFKNVARVRLQLSESAKPTSSEEFAISTDHFDVKYTNQEVESNTYLEKVNGGYRVTKENGNVIQGLILPIVDNVQYQVNVITDENGKDVVTVQTNIPLWVGNARTESEVGYEYQQTEIVPVVDYIEKLISKLQDANWHTVTASPDNQLFSSDKNNPGPLSQYTQRTIKEKDINDLAAKMWTSFEMLRKTVSIRIPSQSFQSFLPNDTVMFTETEDNNGYMNSWEEWFQGSDFDIKPYWCR